MYHFFILANQIEEDKITITGKDVNHIKNVLRMKLEEKLAVTDEDGVEYRCEIEQIGDENIRLQILETLEVSHELPSKIYLFQGLPKSDKMELIIQKAVELGACEVIPMETKRCIVRLDDKKKAAKEKRWNSVAESAAKQSKRSIIPKVHPVMGYREAILNAKEFDLTCIPYEHAEGMKATKEWLGRLGPNQRIGFFIGPEGGFEEEEVAFAVEHGILPISLGKRVLRTETAGMTLLSMVMLELECQNEQKEGF